ncbi:MAG: hypothetical protein H6713_24715 [Myxococcales bacterium]|nr:hypothetical protein [Myxococcales bacterium]
MTPGCAVTLWAALVGVAVAPAPTGGRERAETIDLFSETGAGAGDDAPGEGVAEADGAGEGVAEAAPAGEGGATPEVEDGSSLEWDGDLGDILDEYEDEDGAGSGDGDGDGREGGDGRDGDGSEGGESAERDERAARARRRRELAREVLTGSARLTSAFFHGFDQPEPLEVDDALFAGIFRMLVDHRWNDVVAIESNVFLELARAPSFGLSGAVPTAGSTESAYRLGYLSVPFWRADSVGGQFGLDRLALGIEAGRVSILVGRFPVNHTVSNFFTPNDLFAPYSATAINRIYKPGVDALSVSVLLGNFSSLEVVGALGYAGGCSQDPLKFRGSCEPAWRQSAITARISAVKWGVEWAAMGGKLAQRWIAGGSVQGSIGPVNLRAEGHAGLPDHDGDGKIAEAPELGADGSVVAMNDGDRAIYGRVAAGFDVGFVWHNASIAAEYAFFSSGARRAADYISQLTTLYPDDIPYLGQHHLGLTAGLQPVPIVTLNAFSILNLGDGSGMAGPLLMLSISDEVDLLLGMYVPWGKRASTSTLEVANPVGTGTTTTTVVDALRSEFGVAPLSVFLELRSYF